MGQAPRLRCERVQPATLRYSRDASQVEPAQVDLALRARRAAAVNARLWALVGV